jgi:hypothetical protein
LPPEEQLLASSSVTPLTPNARLKYRHLPTFRSTAKREAKRDRLLMYSTAQQIEWKNDSLSTTELKAES